jgi:hypothetical protein
MPKAVLIPTEIGMDRVFSDDTLSIKISKIGIGCGRYTPTGSETELKDEKYRYDIASSSIDSKNGQITLSVIITGHQFDELRISELGVYLDDGTLFALWSSPDIALFYLLPSSKILYNMVIPFKVDNNNRIIVNDQGLDLKLSYATELMKIAKSIIKINNINIKNSIS